MAINELITTIHPLTGIKIPKRWVLNQILQQRWRRTPLCLKRKTEMTFQRTEKMGNVSFGKQGCYFGIVGTVWKGSLNWRGRKRRGDRNGYRKYPYLFYHFTKVLIPPPGTPVYLNTPERKKPPTRLTLFFSQDLFLKGHWETSKPLSFQVYRNLPFTQLRAKWKSSTQWDKLKINWDQNV